MASIRSFVAFIATEIIATASPGSAIDTSYSSYWPLGWVTRTT